MIEVPGYLTQAVLADNGLSHEELICLEEMSELQKEITKHLRGKGNMRDLIEEMADVYICLKTLQAGMFISDREINEAITEKADRYLRRRKAGDTK
jgi:NTP pyrophosphatase (non-canonical NTP hydrolase)